MKSTVVALFAAGMLVSTVAGCDISIDGTTKDSKGSGSQADTASGASGNSVGAPECDEALEKAAAPDCKDKPGMSAIGTNREQWKSGLSNAATKDATIQGCKAALDAVKAVCSTQAGGATRASAGAGATDSVGAPECDEVIKKAAAPDCKNKPGISAITANVPNWKMGLSNAMTKEATLQACKAAGDTVKAVCGT
jgi:hypothetical protein